MVGKPTITISSSLPKENVSVTLTCTSTNAERILWSRVPSGAPLPSGATLSQDNRTVSFSRIHRSDSGVIDARLVTLSVRRTVIPSQ
ncbi:unnamed protein product [Staurois parvus]|uniref:Ig-like domain-containing protein n=1 Tax=Staurois parvus TaxID=386267 RepID=A0ABN9EAE3_9NEOB|nr:unnamed protein product [Staurois parvus]